MNGVAPLIFTDKVAGAQTELGSLEQFCIQQGIRTTGPAVDKETEEGILEDMAHKLCRTLVSFCKDHGTYAQAASIDLKQYQWRELRDQILKNKATEVRDLAQNIASDATLTEDAVKYGITATAVTALTNEITKWGNLITAPEQAIAGKKAKTGQIRARFNVMSGKMHDLDDNILQFDTTPLGAQMIADYKAARIVRDLGHGPKKPKPPTPPAPPKA